MHCKGLQGHQKYLLAPKWVDSQLKSVTSTSSFLYILLIVSVCQTVYYLKLVFGLAALTGSKSIDLIHVSQSLFPHKNELIYNNQIDTTFML